jgi:sphinganine-1-phosphate aldolase
LLYRSPELKALQGFQFTDWPRGTYATETFLGSRPGGSIASAWAVMQYLGKAGYRRLARKTLEAKQDLIEGIESIAGLRVIRPSDLCIVLFGSVTPDVNIHAVAEFLGTKGWFVGRSREPEALHFALNAVHVPIIEDYLDDLEWAVMRARTSCKDARHDDATY